MKLKLDKAECIDSYISLEELLKLVDAVKLEDSSADNFGISSNDYSMDLVWQSLETDKEYELRIKLEAKEKEAKLKRKLAKEEKERKMLAKLKEKYETI
jgi:uncharacterized protein (DUF736 family)